MPAAKKPAKTAHNRIPLNRATVRREQVALAVSQGKSKKQISKETGISTRRIAEIKAEPDFALRVAALYAPYAKEIHEMTGLFIKSIGNGLKSKNFKEQMDAGDRLLKIIAQIEPKQETAKFDFSITIAELREALAG